mgnify:CR=1 FL=1
MHSVNVSVEFVGYDSEILSPYHFGTNMLFHSDSTKLGSNFDEVIAATGLRFIRYPGGTVSEEYFDPNKPNSANQSNIIDVLSGATNVRTQDVVPLKDFLAYTHNVGARASIVLPTYRYFDPDIEMVRPESEADIRTFIRELLTGTYGKVDDLVIELGNEWYQHRFDWTTAEFGDTQATIAAWIDDEARDLGLRGNVTVLAQTGRSAAENDILASAFEGTTQPTIDGVLTHLYGTNSQGNLLSIGSGINNRLDEINDIWSETLGLEFELAVTEWNVGENGETDTIINGLMRLAPLMRIYGEMLSNGVDLAMIWSTQTNGPAGLSGTEGTGSDFSPTGYFYSMLSHSIQGMRLVDTVGGYHLRDNNENTIGYTYTFEENDNLVSYFVSGIAGEISLDVDLTEFETQNAYVYATVLGAAPGGSGTEYWADASIRHITNIDLSSASGWQFTHLLGSYELVELHVVVGEGVTIMGDSQIAIADILSGGEFADHLAGNLGDDTLSGAGGDDLLEGGDGDDLLSGENDHDTLKGGAGNDTLLGGHGKDFLDGGLGDDFLDGGKWHDTLLGGEGNDTLLSGDGNDTLLGGDGKDLLRMGDGGGVADGGSGQDTLSFLDASEGVSIWRRDGVVELGGQERTEFTNIEVLQGSQHADRFTIDGTGDQYLGEGGQDMFNLLSGSDNLINMGSGDDLVLIFSNNNSEIYGGSGDDQFQTLAGANRLIGETGNDIFRLVSGGQDELVFRAGDGADVVHGFQLGTDRIEFHGLNVGNMQISETNTGTLLDFGADGSIFFDGTFGLDTSNDLSFV